MEYDYLKEEFYFEIFFKGKPSGKRKGLSQPHPSYTTMWNTHSYVGAYEERNATTIARSDTTMSMYPVAIHRTDMHNNLKLIIFFS